MPKLYAMPKRFVYAHSNDEVYDSPLTHEEAIYLLKKN